MSSQITELTCYSRLLGRCSAAALAGTSIPSSLTLFFPHSLSSPLYTYTQKETHTPAVLSLEMAGAKSIPRPVLNGALADQISFGTTTRQKAHCPDSLRVTSARLMDKGQENSSLHIFHDLRQSRFIPSFFWIKEWRRSIWITSLSRFYPDYRAQCRRCTVLLLFWALKWPFWPTPDVCVPQIQSHEVWRETGITSRADAFSYGRTRPSWNIDVSLIREKQESWAW